MTKKLAFMFLTIDNLNKNNIWKKFFDKTDKDKYSIYVHAKYTEKINIQFKYFKLIYD